MECIIFCIDFDRFTGDVRTTKFRRVLSCVGQLGADIMNNLFVQEVQYVFAVLNLPT